MKTFNQIWINLKPRKKAKLAKKMETSVNYLSQCAHGHKKTGLHFANALVSRLSSTKEALFPGVFGNSQPAHQGEAT